MTTDFISLLVITIVSLVSPIIADKIPNKPIPAVVFQVVFGAIFGPFALGFIDFSHAINLLSQLGLAYLFLLAGFEIDPKALFTGERGKSAMATWLVSLALAFGLVFFLLPFLDLDLSVTASVAIAIAISSTAIGTLMPILQERGLLGTPVGETVVAHGSIGEIGPILAMALLLTSRSTFGSIAILVVFFLLAGLALFLPARFKDLGKIIRKTLSGEQNPEVQMGFRFATVLLVALVAVASVFGLDIVLGAFAAGFILKVLAGEESDSLESSMAAVGYGFFIPVFFVVSGAGINILSVFKEPALLLIFVLFIFLVRGVPVYVSTYFVSEDREGMQPNDRLTSALYAATSITIIVAVTQVAVDAGTMSQSLASILIAAGAVTVIVMPILTSLLDQLKKVHLIKGAKVVLKRPSQMKSKKDKETS